MTSGSSGAGLPAHPFDRATLSGPAVSAAPMLLGALLVTPGPVVLRLVEVEAYGGTADHDDPASHAHRGRTARNGTMFGPPGHLYVYRSYGIHLCANVVCGPDGLAGGVLLRAAEVIEGEDLVRARRGPRARGELAAGPGRLGQALGLTPDDDGIDLFDRNSPIRLLAGRAPDRITSGPRIGITRAQTLPWRFWDPDSKSVSR